MRYNVRVLQVQKIDLKHKTRDFPESNTVKATGKLNTDLVDSNEF